MIKELKYPFYNATWYIHIQYCLLVGERCSFEGIDIIINVLSYWVWLDLIYLCYIYHILTILTALCNKGVTPSYQVIMGTLLLGVRTRFGRRIWMTDCGLMITLVFMWACIIYFLIGWSVMVRLLGLDENTWP